MNQEKLNDDKLDGLCDLRSATFPEMRDFVAEMGEQAYKAGQIYDWINAKFARDFDSMTNLSRQFRARLNNRAFLTRAEIAKKDFSERDNTTKYLFRLENHNIIVDENPVWVESVLMDYVHGKSVCVSTQAGCKMGCIFCASGAEGFARNLTAGEMLLQVYEICRDVGSRVSNVTLMGCGEPLDNYDNTLRFIRIINSEQGQNLGQRRITLSTCGITPRISDLMKERLQITLAVSLHAPNDEIRARLMPVAKKYPLEGLLDVCKRYGDETKRRVTFEYAMIDGVNDSLANARELAGRLKNTLCHVNLIPVNEGGSKGFRRSSDASITAFKDTLASNGIEATVRRKLGSGINAACGQLKTTYQN